MCSRYFAPLLGLTFAQSAGAFIDPPSITPASPMSGEIVSVNVRSGVCDTILSQQQLTQSGNAIRVVYFGLRFTDAEICVLPTSTTTTPIGGYPPGSYTLQVDLQYGDVGGSLVTQTLGMVPFVVAGASAQSAPADNQGALLLLTLSIAAGAAWRMRQTIRCSY